MNKNRLTVCSVGGTGKKFHYVYQGRTLCGAENHRRSDTYARRVINSPTTAEVTCKQCKAIYATKFAPVVQPAPQGVHYIGTCVEGQRGRFWDSLTDEQYQALVRFCGGRLPRGYWAWHFQDGESVDNSQRARAVARLPIITNWNNRHVRPFEQVIRAHMDQVAHDILAPYMRQPHTFWRLDDQRSVFLVSVQTPNYTSARMIEIRLRNLLSARFPGREVSGDTEEVAHFFNGEDSSFMATARVTLDLMKPYWYYSARPEVRK